MKTKPRVRVSKEEWHRWFAWRRVKIDLTLPEHKSTGPWVHMWVWGEWIERRLKFWSEGHDTYYRLLPDGDSK